MSKKLQTERWLVVFNQQHAIYRGNDLYILFILSILRLVTVVQISYMHFFHFDHTYSDLALGK